MNPQNKKITGFGSDFGEKSSNEQRRYIPPSLENEGYLMY